MGIKMATRFCVFFLCVQPDGVLNYYHTPYLIDLIRYGSIQVPDFDVPVPEQFSVPEVREHLYVPGSAKSVPSLFGECKDNEMGTVEGWLLTPDCVSFKRRFQIILDNKNTKNIHLQLSGYWGVIP